MRCPFCGMLDSRVVDSRLASEGTLTWRRRECDACKRRFTTYERVEHTLPMVKKRDGKREPFDRDKVLRLYQLRGDRPQVGELERELALSGEREVASQVIGERVMERLKALDEVAYVRFASVYRSFRDVGDFIEEMGKLVREKPTE
ncbi:MAG TPA: transcriptional regulator NrdR [Polyangiaceae bacterium]|nr:transcriptional regulator NrdR [Polyangiaceae bacterium]